MGNVYYCYGCNNTTETTVIEKEQTLIVKGRSITLQVQVRVCAICGEEILDEELDAKTLDKFYNQYRYLENLLFPEKIRAIRQKYHLSQASFAKLLGFGEKTINRYENGAIQDVCHDNLIRLMDSMDSFMLLWNERKDCVSEKERNFIDSMIKTYNSKMICSVYNSAPVYYSRLSNENSFNKGEMSYAG